MIDRRKWVLSEDGTYMELDPSQVDAYKASLKVQTDLWLQGINTHVEFSGECTPDLACCGLPAWSLKVKQHFLAASEKEQLEMLMGCLAIELIESGLDKVHIVVDREHTVH